MNIKISLVVMVCVFTLSLSILYYVHRNKTSMSSFSISEIRSESRLEMKNVKPKQNKSILANEFLSVGDVLINKDEIVVEAKSNVAWNVTSDRKLAFGVYLEQASASNQVIPKNTELKVEFVRITEVALPGKVTSVAGRNVVIKCSTVHNFKVYYVVTVGENLSIVDKKYKGVGRLPTMNELEQVLVFKE